MPSSTGGKLGTASVTGGAIWPSMRQHVHSTRFGMSIKPAAPANPAQRRAAGASMRKSTNRPAKLSEPGCVRHGEAAARRDPLHRCTGADDDVYSNEEARLDVEPDPSVSRGSGLGHAREWGVQ